MLPTAVLTQLCVAGTAAGVVKPVKPRHRGDGCVWHCWEYRGKVCSNRAAVQRPA